jgi:L-ectoine synthase
LSVLVRKLLEIVGTAREVSAENWTSRRLLLESDGMGFSMHDTLIRKHTSTRMWYRHHLEAVYCIEGHGRITHEDGRSFPIEPGTLYALDAHDKHVLDAETDLRLICVFNPPLVGTETHGPDGAYPAAVEG